MAALSSSQHDFLERHDIGLDLLFDATGLSRSEYRPLMKAEGKLFAYGVTRCFRGHELRNRHGVCIQCDTARVGFAKRSGISGYVYIAASRLCSLIKIGMSSDPNNRIYIANLEKYGGATDWQIITTAYVRHAVKTESAIQSLLVGWAARRTSYRGSTFSRECFTCDFPRALSALRDCLTQAEMSTLEIYQHAADYRLKADADGAEVPTPSKQGRAVQIYPELASTPPRGPQAEFSAKDRKLRSEKFHLELTAVDPELRDILSSEFVNCWDSPFFDLRQRPLIKDGWRSYAIPLIVDRMYFDERELKSCIDRDDWGLYENFGFAFRLDRAGRRVEWTIPSIASS